jgi:hypothetical protein
VTAPVATKGCRHVHQGYLPVPLHRGQYVHIASQIPCTNCQIAAAPNRVRLSARVAAPGRSVRSP